MGVSAQRRKGGVVVKNTNPAPVTIPQLYQAVGEKVIARWEALGQTDDKIQWQYGAEADALIPEFPAMTVYAAIAKKAGKTSQTIRKAYYVFRAYSKEQKEKYNLVPYSVFAHARKMDNREDVLKYYVDHQSTPDEIEEKYPDIEDAEIEEEFNRFGLDRIFYSVFREIWGLAPAQKSRVMELVKEIQDIIRKASQ